MIQQQQQLEEEEIQPLIDRQEKHEQRRCLCSRCRIFGVVLTVIVLALLVYAAIIYSEAKKLYKTTFEITELRVLNNNSLCTNPIPMFMSGIVEK